MISSNGLEVIALGVILLITRSSGRRSSSASRSCSRMPTRLLVALQTPTICWDRSL